MKTVFERNHIKLEKQLEQNSTKNKIEVEFKELCPIENKKFVPNWARRHKRIKARSILGFYYYTRVYEDLPEYSTYRLLSFYSDGYFYKLTYPISIGYTKIGPEQRPWNITPGDPSLSDRLVEILFNNLEDLFQNTKHIQKYKSTIYEELFGSPKGPRYQTDNEKILSHGFDLKQSFRKRKES